jgi:hypothetical protein
MGITVIETVVITPLNFTRDVPAVSIFTVYEGIVTAWCIASAAVDRGRATVGNGTVPLRNKLLAVW